MAERREKSGKEEGEMKKEGRKKQARSSKQQGKATQHTQGSHFPKKNELPRVMYTIHAPVHSDTVVVVGRVDTDRCR